MKKVKIKIPAKINLTLDVVGIKDGYHLLKSLVTSVSVYDTVTLVSRNDNKITLTEKGIKSGCPQEKNNAFRSAVAFNEKYGYNGVDIVLEKNIPVAGGMGGSSADIAGVLLGMKKLFGVKDDIKPIADTLGSDSGYMCSGGWAVIEGRGEHVEPLDLDTKFYLLAITDTATVSAGECFKVFDSKADAVKECTDLAVNALKEKDLCAFYNVAKNDLFEPAIQIAPSIKENLTALASVGSEKAIMTGSGSVTLGLFTSKRQRNKAYKKLFNTFGDRLIKAQTL